MAIKNLINLIYIYQKIIQKKIMAQLFIFIQEDLHQEIKQMIKTHLLGYVQKDMQLEGKHSGHGMQNDDKVFEQYMKTVDEYLEKYMPVQK